MNKQISYYAMLFAKYLNETSFTSLSAKNEIKEKIDSFLENFSNNSKLSDYGLEFLEKKKSFLIVPKL